MHQCTAWLSQRLRNAQERFRKPYLRRVNFDSNHEVRVLTVSRAVAKEEGTFAAAGSKAFPGALFCISSARSAIRRRAVVEASSPKETEWKDNDFLPKLSDMVITGGNSLPLLNRRLTNFLDCPVGYSTFPIREENHDWRSVQGGLTKRQNRINSGFR